MDLGADSQLVVDLVVGAVGMAAIIAAIVWAIRARAAERDAGNHSPRPRKGGNNDVP